MYIYIDTYIYKDIKIDIHTHRYIPVTTHSAVLLNSSDLSHPEESMEWESEAMPIAGAPVNSRSSSCFVDPTPGFWKQ